MEKNTAVNLDGKIIISEHEVLPPKDRNKTTKSVTFVFIKRHDKATPLVINQRQFLCAQFDQQDKITTVVSKLLSEVPDSGQNEPTDGTTGDRPSSFISIFGMQLLLDAGKFS